MLKQRQFEIYSFCRVHDLAVRTERGAQNSFGLLFWENAQLSCLISCSSLNDFKPWDTDVCDFQSRVRLAVPGVTF
jgi:hypothetical protein